MSELEKYGGHVANSAAREVMIYSGTPFLRPARDRVVCVGGGEGRDCVCV
jgi:hypothetical protein